MGNILSYFFPKRASANIEQVVDEVVNTSKDTTEEPVGLTAEDVCVMNDAGTEELVVEKEESTERVSTELKEEGFKVVNEDKVTDVINVLQEALDGIQEKFAAKEASPESAHKNGTPEHISDEASENTDDSAKEDLETEVEIIGSIHVDQVDDTSSAEPIKTSIPELVTEAHSIHSIKEEGQGAIETSAPSAEPIKVSTPELQKASTSDPALIPELNNVIPTKPEPPQVSTQELPSAPEPLKVLTIEAIHEDTKAASSEPTLKDLSDPKSDPCAPSAPEINISKKFEIAKESSSDTVLTVNDVTPKVESIGLIEDKEVKNDKLELPGGASGLQDLIKG